MQLEVLVDVIDVYIIGMLGNAVAPVVVVEELGIPAVFGDGLHHLFQAAETDRFAAASITFALFRDLVVHRKDHPGLSRVLVPVHQVADGIDLIDQVHFLFELLFIIEQLPGNGISKLQIFNTTLCLFIVSISIFSIVTKKGRLHM